MKVTLDKDDLDVIIDKMVKENENGIHEVYPELNGLEFRVRFQIYVDGHRDTDYFRGTGAWVCTESKCCLGDLEIMGSEEVLVEYDRDYIEEQVAAYHHD
jgi:hypothetical protein